MLASTCISSKFSDKWAKRLRPTDLRFIYKKKQPQLHTSTKKRTLLCTCGLAAKCTCQNSASPGTFAVHVSLSELEPRKYPRTTFRNAQRPEPSSATLIWNLQPGSFSSLSQVTLPNESTAKYLSKCDFKYIKPEIISLQFLR